MEIANKINILNKFSEANRTKYDSGAQAHIPDSPPFEAATVWEEMEGSAKDILAGFVGGSNPNNPSRPRDLFILEF